MDVVEVEGENDEERERVWENGWNSRRIGGGNWRMHAHTRIHALLPPRKCKVN